jgi:hypothetical protein
MSFDSLQQNFAHATGFIYDRTISPRKMLGQCFIVSKSRAVSTANNLYNYSEAPWALEIYFPHPDITIGVKSIAIHNDFDRREARNYYLQQTGSPLDVPPVLLNDLATIVMDSQLSELQADKVAELNRALSIPFSNQGVEASGNVRGTELFSVINSVLESRREGLLTLYDKRNIPLARLQLGQGTILKAHYRAMIGEMAFAELVYRKPAEGYSFQPMASFNWGGVRDITVPTEQLIQEAVRRANEVPQIINYLSSTGMEARFQRSVGEMNPENVSENIRWFVEILWSALDGYITVDRLPERLGVDTYTILQALRELVNKGYVSLLNRASPFPCNGQLGTPLVSHTDFDINPGDSVTAFYLDPLSGAATWQQGTFFGVSSVLQPKNLLHTIPILPGASGALILKNYKLVGVHGGAIAPKAGQENQRLFQMMWIGALLDMSARKLRTAQEGAEDETDGIAGLRTKLESDTPAAAAEKAALQCPNCMSFNAKPGPCITCGTEIEAPPEEVVPENKVEFVIYKAKKLQEQYNITNKQLAIAGAVIALPLVMMMMCSSPSPPPTAVVPGTETAAPVVHQNSDKAMQNAVEYAGFKATPPPGYWFEDTSSVTGEDTKSFGLYSERANQKVIFIIYDDVAPCKNLSNFTGKPPHVVVPPGVDPKVLEENHQKFGEGEGDFHYYAMRYGLGEAATTALIGSFPAVDPTKCILMIGTSLKEKTQYDYKSGVWLVDQMGSERTKRGNKEILEKAKGGEDASTTASTTDAAEVSTPEQISEFLTKTSEKIQGGLTLPAEAADELKKKKSKKLKVRVVIGVDEVGNLTKIEIAEPSELESVTNAVVKAIKDSTPFENLPKTKDNKLTLRVNLDMEKITVEQI